MCVRERERKEDVEYNTEKEMQNTGKEMQNTERERGKEMENTIHKKR